MLKLAKDLPEQAPSAFSAVVALGNALDYNLLSGQ